ncbi:MAG: DUF29 domain-containing protein [Rhodoferax sp.]|nr:DUF29 domain-containing protein [Rhodoferax sp.]
MSTSYETDVVAWANEQAALIRTGRFDQLDLTNIAEEIEDVGKSEQRELASRMAVLMAHLLKWQYQPEKRATGSSRARTIKVQRNGVISRLDGTPSLKTKLTDPKWCSNTWDDAVGIAIKETGLDVFPDACPWSMQDILTEGWFPED